MAVAESRVLSCERWKQKLYKVQVDEWMDDFSSIMLHLALIINCHGRYLNATVLDLPVLPRFSFNSSSLAYADEDWCERKQKEWCDLMKKWEKAWTKSREFWWFSVQIWNCDCDYVHSVTIKHIYHFLIQLLIKISKIKWISKMQFHVTWPKMPFSKCSQ